MTVRFSRREFGRLALVGTSLAAGASWMPRLLAADKPNSVIHGVRIGVQTSGMTGVPTDQIIPSLVKIGISLVELHSQTAEAMAGAPGAGAGGGARGARSGEAPVLNADGLLPSCANMPMVIDPPLSSAAGAGRDRGQTPEQQAAAQRLRDWRIATTPATWQAVRKKFNDAGIDVPTMFISMGYEGAPVSA